MFLNACRFSFVASTATDLPLLRAILMSTSLGVGGPSDLEDMRRTLLDLRVVRLDLCMIDALKVLQ